MRKIRFFFDASEPHCTGTTEIMRIFGGTNYGEGAQCSGTVSSHLFNADSRVVITFFSHRFPTKPRRTLDLFVEYYVCCQWGRTGRAGDLQQFGEQMQESGTILSCKRSWKSVLDGPAAMAA
jgi:hypothetical protein